MVSKFPTLATILLLIVAEFWCCECNV